jgi:indole-3-glycerol phosphate synthase
MDHKREEIRERSSRTPIDELRAAARDAAPPRNFFRALTAREKDDASVRVIAEVKRKSPSAGWMRSEYEPGPADAGAGPGGFDPAGIAQAYERAGASAISCLTDERFFAGDLAFIERIKAAVSLPVLRKDFILDPWQVYESRAAGADAVLLIGECLRESELIDLMILSHELNMTVLLEFHDPENYFRVRPHIGFPDKTHTLLGINNRDLSTMTTDLGHTLRMVNFIEDTSLLVSESGIRTPEDIARLAGVDVRIVLVGEHLMKQADPGAALSELLADQPKRSA